MIKMKIVHHWFDFLFIAAAKYGKKLLNRQVK